VILGRPSPYEADYVAEVRRLARERGNVIFLEYVDLETLAALYGQAAAHVLPSWSERPGLVSLEAAACGCRVVTSAAAPVWEYLDNNVDVCEPGHGGSIRRAVRNALARESGTVLSDKVLRNYTWDHTARGFKASIESVIGS
jgi:glycosyltransferase involved in cell wall biosynthesis